MTAPASCHTLTSQEGEERTTCRCRCRCRCLTITSRVGLPDGGGGGPGAGRDQLQLHAGPASSALHRFRRARREPTTTATNVFPFLSLPNAKTTTAPSNQQKKKKAGAGSRPQLLSARVRWPRDPPAGDADVLHHLHHLHALTSRDPAAPTASPPPPPTTRAPPRVRPAPPHWLIPLLNLTHGISWGIIITATFFFSKSKSSWRPSNSSCMQISYSTCFIHYRSLSRSISDPPAVQGNVYPAKWACDRTHSSV